MSEEIKYIKKVKISKLWGHLDIECELNADVNVLAGINGSGKSTILNSIHSLFSWKSHERKYDNYESLNLLFNDQLSIKINDNIKKRSQEILC
ncbi:MAG: putative ATP-dependent endonuclease of OLD family [Paraglaciecola sp.]|jgi:predicted ATP-dependent endonuclease of OLD family